MWKDYFGAECQVIGLDINPECKQHEAKGIEIFIGSQDDADVLDEIHAKYPVIDIVIDDGSHMSSQMIASFELLYPRLAENGVYLVEDTCCCYWDEYGGGLKRDNTFIEYAKNKIDEMQASANLTQVREVTRSGPNTLPVTDFMRTTDSVSFYDSIIVFTKRRQARREQLVTTPM